MKECWEEFKFQENQWYEAIGGLEKTLERETGIKGIEFFRNDFGEFAGIGNIARTMKLIIGDDL